MARRGAGNVRDLSEAAGPGTASGEWQRAMAKRSEPPAKRPEPWEPERWVSEGPVRSEATRAVARGSRKAAVPERATGRRPAPPDRERSRADTDGGAARGRARRPAAATGTGTGSGTRARAGEQAGGPAAGAAGPRDDLVRAVGPQRASRLESRLREAAEAFTAERYGDARAALRPLAEQAPSAPAVRELHGLTLYRLGRWRAAAKELEAFRQLTGSTEQHPVLADCYRALGRHPTVEELWDELRAASPSAELVTEGRIVAAGSLADRGDVAGAVRLLERGMRPVKRPRPHHLRLWYALARRYEDVGEVPKARELLARVEEADPEFADVAARRRQLGAG